FTHETYDLTSGNVLRTAEGNTVPLPVMTLSYPDSVWRGPLNPTVTGRSDGTMDNRAVYAFDTIEISPQWQVSAGLRFEHNEGEFATLTSPVARNTDDLF